MKIKNSIDKYMIQKIKENNYSGIVAYLLTFLLNNFADFLEQKEGIIYTDDLKPKHIDKYYQDYLSCYENYLHETVWEFYSFIEKENGKNK